MTVGPGPNVSHETCGYVDNLVGNAIEGVSHHELATRRKTCHQVPAFAAWWPALAVQDMLWLMDGVKKCRHSCDP